MKQKMQEEKLEKFFYALPNIIIGTRDNIIIFINAVGQEVYPDLTPGMDINGFLPITLVGDINKQSVFHASILNKDYTVVLSVDDNIRVYTLISQVRPEATQRNSNVISALRRPLTVADIAASILAPVIERTDENNKSNITILRKSNYVMRRILENTEYLNYLETNQFDLRLQDTDIVKLCDQIICTSKHLIKMRDIDLSFCTKQNELITCVDQRLFVKLLLNLVSNSAKYMEKQGKIVVRVASHGSNMRLSVHDNGPGIPMNKLQSVFEQDTYFHPFTDIHAGAGLGLQVVQAIAKVHNGVFALSSDSKNGTIASASFPIRRSETSELVVGTLSDEISMDVILMELADILDYDVFSTKYLD